MKKKLLPLSIVLSVAAGHVSADNFYPFHARASAMGNTGVASGRSSEAAFYNPGLLSQQGEDKGVEIILGAGAIAADEGDLLDEFDEIDNGGYVDAFDDSITSYNDVIDGIENGSITDPNVARRAAVDVATSIEALDEQIKRLDQDTVRLNAGASLVVAIPSPNFAMAFTASSHTSLAARFDYNDSETVQNYATGVVALTNDLLNGNADPDSPIYGDLVEEDPTTGNVQLKDPTLDSVVAAVAILFNELAIPIAREVEIGGQKFGLGITPKYVKVTTLDYLAQVVEDGDSGIGDVDDELEDAKEEDSNFNLDIGVSYKYKNWTTGLAVRNLISQEYKTVNERDFELKPHARIGGAYSGDWFTLAADLDLTEQNGLFKGQESQFAAFGAEFDLAEIVQLRAGFNHNLSNTDLSMWTAGIGLSPWGVLMELALTSAPKVDAVGGTFQIGYQF